MNRVLQRTVLASCFFISAFSTLAGQLHGQVFITPSEGPAILLSGVELRIYDNSVIDDYIRTTKEKVLPVFNQLEGELARLTPKGEYVPRSEHAAQGKELLGKMISLCEQFWDELPEPQQRTWTDADGKYSIQPAATNYIVFSRAKKNIDGKSEEFVWIILSSTIDPNGPLHLTQHNQYHLIMKK